MVAAERYPKTKRTSVADKQYGARRLRLGCNGLCNGCTGLCNGGAGFGSVVMKGMDAVVDAFVLAAEQLRFACPYQLLTERLHCLCCSRPDDHTKSKIIIPPDHVAHSSHHGVRRRSRSSYTSFCSCSSLLTPPNRCTLCVCCATTVSRRLVIVGNLRDERAVKIASQAPHVLTVEEYVPHQWILPRVGYVQEHIGAHIPPHIPPYTDIPPHVCLRCVA
eukprot:1997715-Pyramimonas_sp.AAC.2